MSQGGDSSDALELAQRALADRAADLAAADRELAEAVAGAHALAVESIGRLDAVGAELDDATADAPKDSPGAAHELTRHLVSANRDIATIVTDVQAAVHAKAVALKELTSRYQ